MSRADRWALIAFASIITLHIVLLNIAPPSADILQSVEKTNYEVAVLMLFSLFVGILGGVCFVLPTVSRLQSELRNIIEGP